MEFARFLRLLGSHAALIATCAICGIAAGVALAIAIPAQYVAHGGLWIDDQAVELVGRDTTGAQDRKTRANSLREILASQRVALRVVDEMKLAEQSDAELARYFPTRRPKLPAPLAEQMARLRGLLARPADGPAADTGLAAASLRRYRLADRLLKRLEVTSEREGGVVHVAYTAGTQTAAAEVANAFMSAFAATALDLSVSPARASTDWYDEQLHGLEQRVDEARGRLLSYQQSSGIVSSDETMGVESVTLSDLSSQLVAAQAQSHPAVQALKSELARAYERLNELPPQLGVNHPDYRRAQAEIAAIQSRLDSQTQSLVGHLQGQISTTKAALLRMKSGQAEVSKLTEELRDGERALSEARQRAEEARLQGEVEQSSVAIVQAAVPPLSAAGPGAATWVAGCFEAGLLLGIGWALWLEATWRVVRDVEDMRRIVAVPLLGVTDRPGSRVLSRGGSRSLPLLEHRAGG